MAKFLAESGYTNANCKLTQLIYTSTKIVYRAQPVDNAQEVLMDYYFV